MPGDWDSPKLRSPLLSLAPPRFDSIRHSLSRAPTHTLSLSSLSLSFSVCLSVSVFPSPQRPGRRPLLLSRSLVRLLSDPAKPAHARPDAGVPPSVTGGRGIRNARSFLAPARSTTLLPPRCWTRPPPTPRFDIPGKAGRQKSRHEEEKKNLEKSALNTRSLLGLFTGKLRKSTILRAREERGKTTRPPPNLDLETHCGYKGSLHAGAREPRLRGDGFF